MNYASAEEAANETLWASDWDWQSRARTFKVEQFGAVPVLSVRRASAQLAAQQASSPHTVSLSLAALS